MNSRSWKRFEQEIAESLGMQRALLKGTDTKEDIASPEGLEATPWVVDAKLRTDLKLWQWMADLVEYAEKKGKPAILAFKVYKKHQKYVIVQRTWFIDKFQAHLNFYSLQPWAKADKRNFDAAWADAKDGAGRTRIPGLLMGIKYGDVDYICIQFEKLIKLMTDRGMIKVKGTDHEHCNP